MNPLAAPEFGTITQPGWQEPPLPEAIAMAPQTWGWWVLAVALVALIAATTWLAWRRHRARAYRRAALAELATLRSTPTDAAGVAAALPSLLKRTALVPWPREHVAPLTGKPWADFLVRTGTGFTPALASELSSLAYARPGTVDPTRLSALLDASERWIRSHRA